MDDGNKTNEKWIQIWEGDVSQFILNCVHPSLQKHCNQLTGGKPNQKVLVPLCGKSLDMLWLAEQGHCVVGADISRVAITSFFKEHNLNYSREPIEMGKIDGLPSGAAVYKASEKDVTLFECDIFKLTSDHIGFKFDAIHDIGAFVALVGDKQKNYVKAVSTLLAPHGRWLIETFDWDPEDPVTEADVHKIFSEDFNIHLLEKRKFTGAKALPAYDEELEVFLFCLTKKK